LVCQKGVPQVGTHVEPINEEYIELLDAGLAQALNCKLGDFLIALHEDFACLFVDDVLSAHLSDQFVLIDRQVDNARLAELLDACPSELGVLSHQDLALVLDVARGTLTLKEVEFDALFCAFTFTQGDGFSVVEILKQVLNAVTESP